MILKNGREISSHQQPYIIAEVNTSHFGDISIAKQMIDSAKFAGCDCVKFQSWSAESINSKSFYDKNAIAKRIFNKFSFSNEKLKEVVEYCANVGISFSSTPYSNDEVVFLNEICKAPFIKVASMELNNYPYLSFIARTGAPIILSTGMGSMDEIKKAVRVIEETGNTNLSILHCVSIYPAAASTIRLKNIIGLQETFPMYQVGFSDHSIGIEMASAAVALGAVVVEKHLTLDKSKIGMDNQIAVEPDELKQLVDNCRNVYSALGDKERILTHTEMDQRQIMRRSIVARRSLKAGTVIQASDLGAKRPGTGIPPSSIEMLVGKVLKNDIAEDTLIYENDLCEGVVAV